VNGGELIETRTLEVSGPTISNLIDELPLLGFIAASLGWEMKLRDAKELRVKESDRIAATVENLSRMGAQIEALPDGWHLQGNARLHGRSTLFVWRSPNCHGVRRSGYGRRWTIRD